MIAEVEPTTNHQRQQMHEASMTSSDWNLYLISKSCPPVCLRANPVLIASDTIEACVFHSFIHVASGCIPRIVTRINQWSSTPYFAVSLSLSRINTNSNDLQVKLDFLYSWNVVACLVVVFSRNSHQLHFYDRKRCKLKFSFSFIQFWIPLACALDGLIGARETMLIAMESRWW